MKKKPNTYLNEKKPNTCLNKNSTLQDRRIKNMG